MNDWIVIISALKIAKPDSRRRVLRSVLSAMVKPML